MTSRLAGHIALIGFMGAGKSSVAAQLSQRYGCALRDIDEAVVAATGRGITDIFERDGQSAFRALEAAALARVLGDPAPAIIACGGGIVLDTANADLLRKHACVVYLEVSARQVLKRIDDASARPLLATIENTDELVGLMESRNILYGQVADVCVRTDERTIEEVCAEIEIVLKEGDYGVFHP